MAGQPQATLCSLAFSDYQLWANPCLRDPNRDGFTSLRTLFRRSPVFLAAAAGDHDDPSEWTEVSVVKALGTHSKDSFDIRMIIVDKTRPRSQNLAGGYELRRKDWAEVTSRFPTFSPEYWDARTVYIENIPHAYRSILGICNLLRAVLNVPNPIQHILFPPHHQDPPDVIPKCKGFALVTLNDPAVLSHLLSCFPYDNNPASAPTDDDTLSTEESEARKAGLRALSKERWDALQAEYVEYRESLLRRIAAAASTSTSNPAPAPIKSGYATPDQPLPPAAAKPHSQLQSYPPGCVLFARHVPSDTNKTALRARFSALLADASALDYVDYSKGLDSCYLRLTTPEYAQALLEAARSKRGEGVQELELELELLEGRREEMYWENVPEKVPALAVQRAYAQTRMDVPGIGQDGNGDEDEGTGGAGHATGTRRRKRRR